MSASTHEVAGRARQQPAWSSFPARERGEEATTSSAPSLTVADRPLSIAYLGDPNSIHFRRWVGFMAERGDRVTLIVADGKPIGAGLPATIAIERFTPFTGHRFRPWGVIAARRSLRRVIARVKPDVLNAHYLTVNGLHAWLSGFHPYVVTLWGSDVFITPKKSRLAALVARTTLRAADMVMVNSDALLRGALAVGAPPDRTEMVQFGVDLTRFAPGPAPAGLRAHLGLEGRRVVFSPRNITPLYRHQVVVEAVATLPRDVAVVFSRHRAQEDELAAVERRVEELGLTDRVVIVPEIAHAEMLDFYRLADVVVSIPASDSTAVTILEALACEKQVVAGDLPSVREWLGELDSSALVPIDDVPATAAALARALDRDPKERAELGRRARAIVEARADQAASLARVESLYRELAAGSHRGRARRSRP
jgi:glycosyltransferase involved in cell wall biosynthesis